MNEGTKMQIIFYWVVTILNALLTIGWRRNDAFNVFIKLLFFAITIMGIVLMLDYYGVVIKLGGC
jgi:hypothetical protein